jgi:hypothetical protein
LILPDLPCQHFAIAKKISNGFYNANGKAAGLGNEGGVFATVTGLPNLSANDFTVVG